MFQKAGYSLALFGFFLFCFIYIHQNRFDGPTAVSRLDLLHAIANEGTFRIDAYHHNTTDKAIWKGHYYSDKAPGTVFAAFPAFVVARVVLRIFDVPLDSRNGWLVSSWISCAGSIAILTSLGAVACFWWLCRYVPTRIALLTVFAVFLGGMPWPYSTMMFSHALVVGLLSISVWALDRDLENINQKDYHRYCLLAGLCTGLALASEYTAGLIVVGIVLWLFRVSRSGAGYFCLATLPPLLLIPLYSLICFGTPFVLPYSAQASFPAMREGLYAIKWPDLMIAVRLLFLPTRGFFFWSPFLLLYFIGVGKVRSLSRPFFYLVLLIPLLHIMVISGRSWDWQAGPAIGPRYLSPLLPFLALPCALAMARYHSFGVYLAYCSVILTMLATITNATPEGRINNPLIDVNLTDLLQGRFCHTLGTVVGLPPWLSVVLFAIVLSLGVLLLHRYARDHLEHAEPELSKRTGTTQSRSGSTSA